MGVAWSLQELGALVEACWHPDPDKRPDFTEVVASLEGVLMRLPRKGPSGCCYVS